MAITMALQDEDEEDNGRSTWSCPCYSPSGESDITSSSDDDGDDIEQQVSHTRSALGVLRAAQCRVRCMRLVVGVLILAQVVLILYPWVLTSAPCHSPDSVVSPPKLFTFYQILTTVHLCIFITFSYVWRTVDPKSVVVCQVQAYVLISLSFWLLGAWHSLTQWCGLPHGHQMASLFMLRVNCAALEFTFLFSVQQRVQLTEAGFGVDLGGSKVARIRYMFFTCQIVIDVVRSSPWAQDPSTKDWCSATYHLVAGLGVVIILVYALRAMCRVKSVAYETPIPKGSFASLERAWSLDVFNRMICCIILSCTVSAGSHLLIIPAVFTVHGAWQPLLVPAYHFADITAELLGLVFIVGIFSPERLSDCPAAQENSRTRQRGSQRSKSIELDVHFDRWNSKVRELAARSIDIATLLDFYRKLGPKGQVMPHFDPHQSTTNDVVRQAIIPLSRVGSGGAAYATAYASNVPMPTCMVTHTWSNLFADLLAAVFAHALGYTDYESIASRLASAQLDDLQELLRAKGVLQQSFWICAFCINQHSSICGGVGNPPSKALDPLAFSRWDKNRRDSTGKLIKFCDCQEPKVLNDQPEECEMNKFDDMMCELVSNNPEFCQLVAVDRELVVFDRVWCVAELVAAHHEGINQSVYFPSDKAFDLEADDITIYEKLVNLTVAGCQASRPEDKEMVMSKIDDVQEFDAELQALIFGNRGLLTQKFIGFDALVPAARCVRRLAKLNTCSSEKDFDLCSSMC